MMMITLPKEWGSEALHDSRTGPR